MRHRSLSSADAGYAHVLAAVAAVVENARRTAVRSINSVMTTTYWEIGRRIVEREQAGAARAGYGEALLQRLSGDLTQRFGRGFSVDRLETARLFYLAYPSLGSGLTSPSGPSAISATTSRKSKPKKSATLSRKSTEPSSVVSSAPSFRLSWSHYVILTRRLDAGLAREFYEAEALRGGWTVRQLERQIESQFFETILRGAALAACRPNVDPSVA